MNITLVGLKTRLMLMLYQKNNFVTVKSLQKTIYEAFRNGTCDKAYSYNRICIALRELNGLEMIDKKEASQGTWGRSQLYKINASGVEVLRQNMLIPSEGANNV